MLNRIKSVGEYLFRGFVQIDQTNFLKHTWVRWMWFCVQVLHSFRKKATKYFVTQIKRTVIRRLGFFSLLKWVKWCVLMQSKLTQEHKQTPPYEQKEFTQCTVIYKKKAIGCVSNIRKLFSFFFFLLPKLVLYSSVCCI